MKILLDLLYSNGDHFEYSNEVEKVVGKLIGRYLEAFMQDPTEGYSPEYDFKLNGTKIELKITSKFRPEIEFATADYNISGIQLTRSKYYLIISPGRSKGILVGKLRLYDVNDLKEKVAIGITEGNIIRSKASDDSPGSLRIQISPKNINHHWLGDCDIILENDKIVGYDISTFKATDIKYIKHLFT